jgi:hypothetical protein
MGVVAKAKGRLQRQEGRDLFGLSRESSGGFRIVIKLEEVAGEMACYVEEFDYG